jgi:phosphoserine aminotransferase
MLPLSALERAAAEMTDYDGTGMSVMEMSHRSAPFQRIMDATETNLRTLMGIPDGYDVLFLQGGATLQFSMVPMNLMTGSGKADYIITGSWSEKAATEAKKFGDVREAASSKEANFTYIPKVTPADFRRDADYVHITWNNTIFGTKFPRIPDTGGIPLVCDASSGILAEEIDVSKFALIYAGAQKNIGPAGVTIVIIRKDFVGKAPGNAPIYLDYKTHADSGSMYNTPPCWNIYMAGEVFKELLAMGGIAAAEKRNLEQAAKLYGAIDASRLFSAPAAPEDRSLMNVVFVTGDAELDKKFVAEAKGQGLLELGGHRSVGGMRASIYNAMPDEGVDRLIEFMKNFEEKNL